MQNIIDLSKVIFLKQLNPENKVRNSMSKSQFHNSLARETIILHMSFIHAKI